MTKKENFIAIRELVADNAELVAFCDHEIELLAKKNSYKSTKPTAKQVANAALKDTIVEVLRDSDEPLTISGLIDSIEGDFTSQKMSALVSALVRDGIVTRTVGAKRVPYFSIG
jgi:hypothetical protein